MTQDTKKIENSLEGFEFMQHLWLIALVP